MSDMIPATMPPWPWPHVQRNLPPYEHPKLLRIGIGADTRTALVKFMAGRDRMHFDEKALTREFIRDVTRAAEDTGNSPANVVTIVSIIAPRWLVLTLIQFDERRNWSWLMIRNIASAILNYCVDAEDVQQSIH